jgi:cytochrome o ubiquinol oxidase operon protein cyoD
MKHPGLNLGAAHGKDHEAAERMMFGFWVFMMSDAILFEMVFATCDIDPCHRQRPRAARSLRHQECVHRNRGAADEQLRLRHGLTGAQVQAQQDAAGWMAGRGPPARRGLSRFRTSRLHHHVRQGGRAQPQRLPFRVLRPGAPARPARHGCLRLAGLPGGPTRTPRFGHKDQTGYHAPGPFLAFPRQCLDRDLFCGLPGGADMSGQGNNWRDQSQRQQQERRDFFSYVWGIGLGLLLTLVPFALVHWAYIPRFPLLIVIGEFALVQMVVHFRFFLHIGFKQKREDLHLILFSTLLLTIMVVGTIWIMASLALRMTMPASP